MTMRGTLSVNVWVQNGGHCEVKNNPTWFPHVVSWRYESSLSCKTFPNPCFLNHQYTQRNSGYPLALLPSFKRMSVFVIQNLPASILGIMWPSNPRAIFADLRTEEAKCPIQLLPGSVTMCTVFVYLRSTNDALSFLPGISSKRHQVKTFQNFVPVSLVLLQ